MLTLGIWDGHDSGVAVVEDGKILFAANEERFTRRKQENCFPDKALLSALAVLKLSPSDFDSVAGCTSDFTNFLTRVFPGMKDGFYAYSRRSMGKPAFDSANKLVEYKLGDLGSSGLFRAASKGIISRKLARHGFRPASTTSSRATLRRACPPSSHGHARSGSRRTCATSIPFPSRPATWSTMLCIRTPSPCASP